MLALLLTNLILWHAVSAAVIPVTPGPSVVYKMNERCPIEWKQPRLEDVEDPIWDSMTIELMTGPNLQQVVVTKVVTMNGNSLDLTAYGWTCPYVDVPSDIYFYRFTPSGDSTKAVYTARFTIARPDGYYVPPLHKTQPNTDDPIPWGIGKLSSPTSIIQHENEAKDTTNPEEDFGEPENPDDVPSEEYPGCWTRSDGSEYCNDPQYEGEAESMSAQRTSSNRTSITPAHNRTTANTGENVNEKPLTANHVNINSNAKATKAGLESVAEEPYLTLQEVGPEPTSVLQTGFRDSGAMKEPMTETTSSTSTVVFWSPQELAIPRSGSTIASSEAASWRGSTVPLIVPIIDGDKRTSNARKSGRGSLYKTSTVAAAYVIVLFFTLM